LPAPRASRRFSPRLRLPLPRRPPRPPLFPYTTLFRSLLLVAGDLVALFVEELLRLVHEGVGLVAQVGLLLALAVLLGVGLGEERSEEHTSELQSRENLVCRLLLEKKNNAPQRHGRRRQ